jgi:hypothetical protein
MRASASRERNRLDCALAGALSARARVRARRTRRMGREASMRDRDRFGSPSVL